MAGMEEFLHQLIEVEGFKLGAFGLDVAGSRGDLNEVCRKGRELAHRYGLKFLVSMPREYANQAGGQIAGWADLLSIDFGYGQENAVAAIEEQRRLYRKILGVNPGVTLFQNVSTGPEGSTQPPARLLREHRGNADLVRGILVSGPASQAQAGPLLRAIRPPVDQPYAAARNEGPSLYFFNFLWNTPGWQPREGDYAFVKIRPALKTLEQKVNYCLAELKDIPPERRKIMANGLAGTAELLRELIEVKHFGIAALDYDLEGWELTPEEEKTDPIAACKRGQALADKYKLAFVVVPDMPMSKRWGPRIAPFVAGMAPQCKGLQAENIDDAIIRQRNLYSEIRRANPGIALYHDLGAALKGVLQSAKGLLHYYTGVADLVDGIEIWSQDVAEQNAVIGKYIIAVRPPWQPAVQSGTGTR